MMSNAKRKTAESADDRVPYSVVEDILEKKIEDIVNLLSSIEKGKSTLYADVMSLVERCLLRIALRRCEGVKTSAAGFLGINRNTLHKKMEELNIKTGK
jgi:DNA-binding protein Fis